MFTVRTDLILEAHEALLSSSDPKIGQIEGIKNDALSVNGFSINRVSVLNEKGEQAIGKKRGEYITVEAPRLTDLSGTGFSDACFVLANELKRLGGITGEGSVLVAGLGNKTVTADSLGPKTVGNVMVTKHLVDFMPDKFKGQFRPVCAITPGVLATTGMETANVIAGICNNVKPETLIVIDSLAARSLSRLGTTMQLSDTGLSPGSGVGNTRLAIDKETLGIPVIAIGVPTVVDAATLTCDVLDGLASRGNVNIDHDEVVKNLSPDEKQLFVTPKDIDDLITAVSKVVGFSINLALQKDLEISDIISYLS